MPNSLVGIGVIGYGYWGPNLVRNFASNECSRVISVSDLDRAKLAISRRLHPEVETTSDFRDLLQDHRVDAVAIATPVHTHYDLALAALRAGKHVFVEKPLAPTADQVRRLMEEADKRNLVLMVDHTFLYTPAVEKIRELVQGGTLGDIYYYDSIRSSLGLFQSDVNVPSSQAAVPLINPVQGNPTLTDTVNGGIYHVNLWVWGAGLEYRL